MAERWSPWDGEELRPGTDVHKQHVALAVVLGTPLIALVFTCVRFWAKRKTGWGPDDYTIFLATALFIAVIYPSWRHIKMWHFGIHLKDVNQRYLEPNMDDNYKMQLWFHVCHGFILPLVKASILILLLRVGKVIDSVRRIIYITFVFNALSAIVIGFLLFFMCPLRTGNRSADRTFGNAKCLSRLAIGRVNITQVCINMFTDLIIFPIPCYITWHLQHVATIKSRILIVFLFLLSLSVTAIGAVKVYFTYNDRLYVRSGGDWTYDIYLTVNHWESCVAIVVACIPSFRIIFLRRFRKERRNSQATAVGPIAFSNENSASGGHNRISARDSFFARFKPPGRRGTYDNIGDGIVELDLEKAAQKPTFEHVSMREEINSSSSGDFHFLEGEVVSITTPESSGSHDVIEKPAPAVTKPSH